jgi:hypothetical protein
MRTTADTIGTALCRCVSHTYTWTIPAPAVGSVDSTAISHVHRMPGNNAGSEI